MFLLHAAPAVKDAFEYLLAVACDRFGIRLSAYVAMSNHVHYVVTDPDARLPEFTTWLHAMIARAVNHIRGRSGTFWEREQVNQPVLADKETVVDKIAYTLANPTRAGLVPHGHQWLGARSRPEDFGKTRVLKRPKIRLFDGGTLPESVKLHVEVPPSHQHLNASEFAAIIEAATELKEKSARDLVKAEGRSFSGVEKLRAVPWSQRPRSLERRARGRDMRPVVLAACKELKLGLLSLVMDFRHAYRRAMKLLQAGERDVTFPAGTWLVARLVGTRG